jgi:ubiquinol-cytochrome c reductase iron-sulfur subunit
MRPVTGRQGRKLMSHTDDTAGTRRDFLYVATAATGAVATGAAIWPLINQMNPSAETQAVASIEVDVADVEVGTQLTVKWRGKPVFIRRRSQREIDAARATPLEDLKDQIDKLYENPNLQADSPALDENRTMDVAGEWLVMIGICTHLGCVPVGNESGDFGGWFCPCHGSHYDTSGRIRKGPAPRNLDIPLAAFIEDTLIKVG